MSARDGTIANTRRVLTLKRLFPLAVLAFAILVFFLSGLYRQITFDTIALRYGALASWVEARPLLAVFVAILAYALATTLSFPAAWLLTVTAGLLLGWAPGSLAVVIGATLGACALYFAAKLALAEFFVARAGNALNKMAEGFRQDAVSYMLFLRLAPVFPFTLVNVVPAILGVSFPIFAVTTAVGIIPGVIAYAFAGEGLRSIVAERAEACAAGAPPCGTGLNASDLITPQILIAFALLAVVSLIPVALKRLRASKH